MADYAANVAKKLGWDGRIVIGGCGRAAEPRTHQIAELFRRAGVPCDVTDHLALSHWDKLAWNIPFNGLGVASSAGYEAVIAGEIHPGPRGLCLTTDQFLADPSWNKLVRDLISEVVHTAQKLGLPLGEEVVEQQIARTLTMGAYKPSTVLDFERGQPLRQARSVKASTPRLAALVRVLASLNQR